MNGSLPRSKIDAAEQQLALAEKELAEAIGELRGVPRAEKTVTTRLIEDALDKVRASRERLGELRSLASPDEGPC